MYPLEMVEIFKTNVQEVVESEKIIQFLLEHFPFCKINFDLEDCDKILRVEGKSIEVDTIIEKMKTCGYHCETLI
jgi:hypothetical protein